MEPARVLIVDDDPIIRASLVDALAVSGVAADGVSSAEDALASTHRRRYAMLVVDRVLPGMGGVELIRTLRATEPELAFAVITARPSPQSLDEVQHLGVSSYFLKPLDLPAVVKRVNEILETRRGQRRIKDVMERLRSTMQALSATQPLRVVVMAPATDRREWLTRRTGNSYDSVLGVGAANDVLELARNRGVDLLIVDAPLDSDALGALLTSTREISPGVRFVVVCDRERAAACDSVLTTHAVEVLRPPLETTSYRERVTDLIDELRRVRSLEEVRRANVVTPTVPVHAS